MFRGRPANHPEEPRPKCRVSVKDRSPVENLQIRILQDVVRLGSIEPAARHRPADTLGVVTFERRPKVGQRRDRRGCRFRNAYE